MTTWYVTTGVSLWQQSRCWRLDGVSAQVLEEADTKSVSKLQETEEGRELLARWKRKREALKDSLLAMWTDFPQRARDLVASNFRQECWEKARVGTLPAELTTLYLLLHRQDEHRVKEEDPIVFLVGDSNREVGYVLQAILQQVGCMNPVEVLECGNLDPKKDEEFNRAMSALAERIRETRNDFRLVLTGGYKGVLIALARSFASAYVYYNHEGSPQALICFCGREVKKIEPPID